MGWFAHHLLYVIVSNVRSIPLNNCTILPQYSNTNMCSTIPICKAQYHCSGIVRGANPPNGLVCTSSPQCNCIKCIEPTSQLLIVIPLPSPFANWEQCNLQGVNTPNVRCYINKIFVKLSQKCFQTYCDSLEFRQNIAWSSIPI